MSIANMYKGYKIAETMQQYWCATVEAKRWSTTKTIDTNVHVTMGKNAAHYTSDLEHLRNFLWITSNSKQAPARIKEEGS
jgi:hypothetical protein